MTQKKRFIILSICIIAVLAALTSCAGTQEETTLPPAPETEAPDVEILPLPYEVTGIEQSELISGVGAKHALLTKVDGLEAVASKSSSERMYPASMTKVMTFIVAYENAASLADKTAITQEMKNKYPDASRLGIDAGDILTTEQLLYALLLESDTDAAIARAEYVSGSEAEFVKLMNAKCEELGLTATSFANVTGLHHENHYTTAKEMTSIFAYALDIPLFREIITTKTYVTYLEYYKNGVLTEYRMTFQNTTLSPVKGRFAQNGVSLDFGSGEIIGGKTGFTDEARYCLALLVKDDAGNEYILITAKSNTPKANASDCNSICKNYID